MDGQVWREQLGLWVLLFVCGAATLYKFSRWGTDDPVLRVFFGILALGEGFLAYQIWQDGGESST